MGQNPSSAHLLWTFLVDMLERVLRLLLVGPHEVGKLGQLARLRICPFLDSVNVVDIVLP
jgi:hypothetical protein